MLAVSLATVPLLDVSIASSMMGLMFPVYTAPVLSLVFVAWAVATRRMADSPRRITLVAAIVLASGFWTTLRTDGMTGDASHDLTWRWTETAEARLLATAADERLAPPPATKVADDADWPGFRGRNRDGIVRGIRIATDWGASPPEELWRRPVGPGVGSFSVRGQQVFTQEQRGDQEMVSSYLLATGEPVWRHADPVRFWDSHAGAGPRGTPTVAGRPAVCVGRHRTADGAGRADRPAVVGARRGRRARRDLLRMGFRRLAAGSRRVRDRCSNRHAGRLRCRDRRRAVVRAGRGRQLQLAASRDPRWGAAGAAAHLRRRHQRCTGRRQGAVDPRLGHLQPHRAAGADRRWRHPGRRRRLRGSSARIADAGRRRTRWLDNGSALDDDRSQAVLQRLRRARGPRLRLSTAASWPASTWRPASAPGRGAATVTGSSCCWPTRTCCSSWASGETWRW